MLRSSLQLLFLAILVIAAARHSPAAEEKPSLPPGVIQRFGSSQWRCYGTIGYAAAFSPDGKLLAAGLENGGIRFWDVSTGRVLLDAPAHRMAITSLSFADAKIIVSGSLDGTAMAWDVDRLLKSPAAQGDKLESLWASLGQTDGEKAAPPMQAFAARPKETLAFFKQRLQPMPIVAAKHIDKLVADLQSDQFAVRQRANVELEIGRAHV